MFELQPLCYATYDADGLPPIMPEVEALIDARRRLKTMGPFFRSKVDLSRYVARSLRRRRALEHVASTCECCNRPTNGLYAPIEWILPAKRQFLEFAVFQEVPPAMFLAYHAICEHCLAQWQRRWMRFEWVARSFRCITWTLVTAMILVGAFRHGSFLVRGDWFVIFDVSCLLIGIPCYLLLQLRNRVIPAPIRKSVPREARFRTVFELAYLQTR